MGASQTKQAQKTGDSGLIPLYHEERDDSQYSNEDRASVRTIEELTPSQMLKLAAFGTQPAFVKGPDSKFYRILAYYYPTNMIGELTDKKDTTTSITICNEIITYLNSQGLVIDPSTMLSAYNYILVNRCDIDQAYAVVYNMLVANNVAGDITQLANTVAVKLLECINGSGTSRSMNRMVRMGGDPYDALMTRTRTGGADDDNKSLNLELPTNMYLERIAERREQVIGELLGMFDKLDYEWIKETSALDPGQRLRKITEYLRVHKPTNAEGLISRIIESINKTYGITVIEPSSPLKRKLQDTTEFMNALSHGMCVDFFALGIDMKRYMNNLGILNEALVRWNETASKMYPKLQEEHIQNSFKKLISDQKRAINLIRVTLQEKYAPTLLGLMNSQENPNMTSNDRVMALNALTKMHSVADAALFLVQLIRELGLEFDKIKSLKSKSELLNALVGADESGAILGEPGTQKLLEFALGAMSRDYNEIVLEMDRVIKRDNRERETSMVDDSSSMGSRITGSADPSKLVLNKIKMRQNTSDLFLNTYGRVMEGGINKIRDTIDSLSQEIGKAVPTGQLLDNFIILLRQLSDVQLETNAVHRALLGFHKDAGAQEERTRIIGILEEIAKYAEMIATNSEYTTCADSFMSISRAIREFISGVDQSRDNFKRIVGANDEMSTSRNGGDTPLDTMIGNMRNVVVRSRLRLQDAIDRAEYKSRVVTIKANLSTMQVNFKKNIQQYDTTVLGPAVARRLDELTKAAKVYSDLTAHDPAATLCNNTTNKISKEGKEFMNTYIGYIRDFWESAQSVELYLKYFTNDLISNATDIDDIMQMIREVRLVTKMYHDSIGSNLYDALSDEIDPALAATNPGLKSLINIINQNKITNTLNDVTKGIKQYNALKNLISFFVHFGSKIGGSELRKLIPRSPQTIYKGLINFMIANTFMVGTPYTGSINTRPWSLNSVPIPNIAELSVYLRNVKIHKDSIYNDKVKPLSLNIESELFTAIIKAFGAKILVLSGVHDLINRPHEPLRRQNLIRSIIGAGDESFPTIEPDVVELYLRLVLLAQYYQEEFVKSNPIEGRYSGSDNARIILIPELSGSEFSSFINLMFTKMTHREVKYFTDNEIKALIIEINKIWASLSPKFQKDKIRSIARAFIHTISNMLYIVRKKDMSAYEKSRKRNLNAYGREDTAFDIDILGDEGYDDEQIFRPPLPDAQYRSSAGSTDNPIDNDDLMNVDMHWDLVRKFRMRLDAQMNMENPTSLRTSIIATQSKLAQTTGDNDRFSLICGMLRGTGAMTTIDEMRRMIFVEVMGTSLGLIYEMFVILQNMRNIAYIMNPDNLSKCIAAIRDDTSITVNDNLPKQLAKYVYKNVFNIDIIRDKSIYDNCVELYKIIMNGTYIDRTQHIIGIDVSLFYNYTKTAGVDNPNDQQIKVLTTHYVNRFSGMQILLNYIMRTVNYTHELVHVNITDGRIYVDFGSFSEYISKYFVSLNDFVNAMRPHIDQDLINNYTAKERIGSLYYLYNSMITSFVEGDQYEERRESSFVRMTQNITRAYEALTSKIDIDIASNPESNPYYIDYSTVMARMIAHGDGSEIKEINFKRADVVTDGYDALLVGGNIDAHLKDRVVDTRFLHGINITEPTNSLNINGMFLSFNKQIHQYLRSMYDPAAGKIYAGLVAPLRDTFTDAIHLERDTYPDHLPYYWIESGKLHDTAIPSNELNMMNVEEVNRSFRYPYDRYIDELLIAFSDDPKKIGINKDKIMPFYDSNSYYGDVHKFVFGLAAIIRMDKLTTDDDYNILYESILYNVKNKNINITVTNASIVPLIEGNPAVGSTVNNIKLRHPIIRGLFVKYPYDKSTESYGKYMNKVILQTLINVMSDNFVLDDLCWISVMISGSSLSDHECLLIGLTLSYLTTFNIIIPTLSTKFISSWSKLDISKIIRSMSNYPNKVQLDAGGDVVLINNITANIPFPQEPFALGGFMFNTHITLYVYIMVRFGLELLETEFAQYLAEIVILCSCDGMNGFPNLDFNVNVPNITIPVIKKLAHYIVNTSINYIKYIQNEQFNVISRGANHSVDIPYMNTILFELKEKSWIGISKPLSIKSNIIYTEINFQNLVVDDKILLTYLNDDKSTTASITRNSINGAVKPINILINNRDRFSILISIFHRIIKDKYITLPDVKMYCNPGIRSIESSINKIFENSVVQGNFLDALTVASITVKFPDVSAKRIMNIRNGTNNIKLTIDYALTQNIIQAVLNNDEASYKEIFINYLKQIPNSFTTSKGYVTDNESRVRHIISLDDLNNSTILEYDDRLPDYSGTFIVFAGDEGLDQYSDSVIQYHHKIHPSTNVPTTADFMNTYTFNERQIPDGKHVLFATIAHRLHNIFYTRDNVQTATHVIASAAEIPTHMREKIRAHAPYYRAMFLAIIHKGEFMRQLIENTSITSMNKNVTEQISDYNTFIDKFDTWKNSTTIAPATANQQYYNYSVNINTIASKNFENIGYNFGDKNIKTRVLELLRSMIDGSQAIVKACDDTIAAIGDTPHYFETSRDSIATYRAQNNTDPIMPISPLINAGYKLMDNVFIPESGINTSGFKFQYAIRGLYNRKIENDEKAADTLTAFTSMINTFNKYAHGHIKIDDSLTNSIARSIIMGFDYVFNSEQFQHMLAGMVDIDLNILRSFEEQNNIYVPFGININDSVMIVESLTRSDAIHKVLNTTLGSNSKTNANMLYANIIDLNMVPFDIHVLARQLPFHFVLNYAYTFDTIVADMMSLPGDHINISDDDVNDARRAFMSLISKPMKEYNNDERNWIYRVINGAVNLPYFGQPKFLSDQMMAKILTKDNTIGTDLASSGTYYQIKLNNSYILAPQSGVTDICAGITTVVLADITNFTINMYNETKNIDNNIIKFINNILRKVSDKIDVRKHIKTIYDIIIAVASNGPWIINECLSDEMKNAIRVAIPNTGHRKLSYVGEYDENNIMWKMADIKFSAFYEKSRLSNHYYVVPHMYIPSPDALKLSTVNYNKVQISLNAPHSYPIPYNGTPAINPISVNNIKLIVNPIDNSINQKDTSLGPLFDMTIIRNLVHIHLVFETVQMRLNSDLTYMNPNIHEQSVVTDRGALSQSMYHFYGPEYTRDSNKDNTINTDSTI